MDAVRYWGQALIEDPARVGTTKAAGVDETKFLVALRREPTRWASAICDIDRRCVIDVIEGRQGPDLDAWLARQPAEWRQGVEVTVTDLHEPFRRALAARLPAATAVADPFHVVGVGTRVVERTRRRVQQETLSHRGHKHDPLYRGRKLLTLAAERLDDGGTPSCGACSLPVTPTARSTRRGPPRKACVTCTRCGVPSTWPAAGSTG